MNSPTITAKDNPDRGRVGSRLGGQDRLLAVRLLQAVGKNLAPPVFAPARPAKPMPPVPQAVERWRRRECDREGRHPRSGGQVGR